MSVPPRLTHMGEGVYLLDPALKEVGPDRLEIRARKYERIMDYVYTPIPLERLSRAQIQIVNMLREYLIEGKHIGGTDNQIKDKFAEIICSVHAQRVLEWGCGFDSLQTRLPNISSYEATDIDPAVINFQRKRGAICRLTENMEKNIEGKVDVIPSIFVFQFGISNDDMAVMSNALAPRGFVLANVYRRSPESRNRLRKKLAGHGLSVYRRRDLENLCKGNEYWIASKGLSEAESVQLLGRLNGIRTGEGGGPVVPAPGYASVSPAPAQLLSVAAAGSRGRPGQHRRPAQPGWTGRLLSPPVEEVSCPYRSRRMSMARPIAWTNSSCSRPAVSWETAHVTTVSWRAARDITALACAAAASSSAPDSSSLA